MEVCFLLNYGGCWEEDQNGSSKYVGGKVTGLSVSKDLQYDQFLKILYETLEVDEEKFVLKLTAKFSTLGSEDFQIITIDNDRTVKFYLQYCSTCGKRLPQLMVEIQERETRISSPLASHGGKEKHVMCSKKDELNSIVRSASGSNQSSHMIRASSKFSNYIHGNKKSTENAEGDKVKEGCALDAIHDQQLVGVEALEDIELPATVEHSLDDETVDSDSNHSFDAEINVEEPVAMKHVNSLNNVNSCSKSDAGTHSFDDALHFLPPIMTENMPSGEDGSFSKDPLNIEVGEVFASKVELRTKLASVATRKNFEFTVSRSSKDRFEVVCRHQKQGCKWRLRATRVNKEHEIFEVRRFDQYHTCEKTKLVPCHKQASAHFLGTLVKHNFEDCSKITRPRDIMKEVQSKIGVNISYHTAWRTKESALKQVIGDPAESFQLLPRYCHMLEASNPGTVSKIATDSQNHFEYCFSILGASKNRFLTGIRPVVAVDGAFLKSKYRGTLFLASCLDGNGQIFPLAFGVGDSENDESWEWFLRNLHEHIGMVEGLVFVSDRHKSIIKAVQIVFPHADHGYCIQHIKQNLKAKLKWEDKLLQMFLRAAKEYRLSDFDEIFTKIRTLSPAGAEYLQTEIGFKKWARSHFDRRRYSIMTTNISESMNSLLKDARCLPITMLLEFFRKTIQKWFADRREEAIQHPHVLTPWAKKIIDQRIEQSRTMRVAVIDISNYEVFDDHKGAIVDMNGRTCTCRVFDLDLLPCAHALAVCEFRSFENIHVYCSNMYYTERWIHTYATTIMPLGHSTEWVIPDEVQSRIVLPPQSRIPCGRRRKKRILSIGETSSDVRRKCSRCERIGHNRQTCRFPLPLERPSI